MGHAVSTVPTSPRITLVTCDELPDLDADERHLLEAFAARGVTPTIASWTGPRAPFLDADVVVLRCPWDYTTKREAFLAFVDDVASKTSLHNAPDVIRWNTDKRYLQQLAEAGVATVPTRFVDRDEDTTLAGIVDQWGADIVVVKPVVGAGSRDTFKLSLSPAEREASEAVFTRLRRQEALMVQPFLSHIADGEVSMIFLDGAFSHAVNKVPKGGDFRSQPEFGSNVVAYDPTDEERAVADAAVRAMDTALARGQPLLYARVDLVRDDARSPCLIELEVTEPSLYFGWNADAAGRCADAILGRL